MHIVLVEPEIPGNTGNIARLCAATGAELHLVKPLGFSIADKQLKRAGLDYWHLLKVHVYENIAEVFVAYPHGRFFYNTTKAVRSYSEIEFVPDDFIVFGRETAGLPAELLADNPNYCLRIPMVDGARSLNLSNAVAIVLYDALRQNAFAGLV
ncbi:MAG: tRNA (cytidine(34)-2'-O)-methyltransferase [Negativicutes bacterium]|jgi:tRNA (cytidine/uridine-2'-O-)-methyltransferase